MGAVDESGAISQTCSASPRNTMPMPTPAFFLDNARQSETRFSPSAPSTPSITFQGLPAHAVPSPSAPLLGGTPSPAFSDPYCSGPSGPASFPAARCPPRRDQQANYHRGRIRSPIVGGVGVATAVVGGAASFSVGGVPVTVSAGVSLATGSPYVSIVFASPVVAAVGLLAVGGFLLAESFLSGDEERDSAR